MHPWDPDRNATSRIGILPRIGDGEEEPVLVLSEPSDTITEVLVLYDSIRAGVPGN